MSNKKAAFTVVKTLRKAGCEALFAGGCVRDMLLKKRPKDYDVATNAHPDKVCRLFRRHRKVGSKFGVVMVLLDDQQIEVATFRTESSYSDNRRPDNVQFTDAKKDAQRRDFTINGMFYDPIEKKIIDYVNGKQDLTKRIIRTIGKPKDRFNEDYLRMLRAVRFASRLHFQIEQHTFQAIQKNATEIIKISPERIALELEIILTDQSRKTGLKLLFESGLGQAIFPDLTSAEISFAQKVMENIGKTTDFALAYASLFCSAQTKKALHYCSFLKLSNAVTKHITCLLDNRDQLLEADMPLAKLKILASSPYFNDLYRLQRAMQKARNWSIGPLKRIRQRLRELKGVNLNPKPLIDGHELIRLGVGPGPQVGQAAAEMYIEQLSENIKTRQDARNWIKKWLREHTQKQ
jgi:tRNA nucleotidyltransferase/poly(A) polymerase